MYEINSKDPNLTFLSLFGIDPKKTNKAKRAYLKQTTSTRNVIKNKLNYPFFHFRVVKTEW